MITNLEEWVLHGVGQRKGVLSLLRGIARTRHRKVLGPLQAVSPSVVAPQRLRECQDGGRSVGLLVLGHPRRAARKQVIFLVEVGI
jgi:hypothetical protein